MMRKIAVFGLSGTGKTTLALRLATLLGAPHHDLDRILFTGHGPLPLAEFRTRVAALTDADDWVVDGNYSRLADVTWHRADAVVWLDYRLTYILWRITVRCTRRMVGREPPPAVSWRQSFFSRRALLYVTVRKYTRNRRRYARQVAETEQSGVPVLRFRTPGETEKWVSALAARR